MNVFINDCLLQNDLLIRHLENEELLFNSIRNLCGFFNTIKEKKLEYNNQISIKIYLSSGILKSFFDFISQKDLENLFRIQLGKVSPIFWDVNPIQNHECQYYFFDHTVYPAVHYIVNNTSLAEAYEYNIKFEDSVLSLNFPDSVLSKQKGLLIISVKNNSSGTKTIQCADDEQLLIEWIEQNIDNTLFVYNKKSAYPPTDLQTCLRSKIRFEDTGELYDNVRKIYRDKVTNNKWYVDNLHYGERSHIEVFDFTGNKFIGEATIDGVLIPKIDNPHNKSKSQKRKEKRKLRR